MESSQDIVNMWSQYVPPNPFNRLEVVVECRDGFMRKATLAQGKELNSTGDLRLDPKIIYMDDFQGLGLLAEVTTGQSAEISTGCFLSFDEWRRHWLEIPQNDWSGHVAAGLIFTSLCIVTGATLFFRDGMPVGVKALSMVLWALGIASSVIAYQAAGKLRNGTLKAVSVISGITAVALIVAGIILI